MKKLNKCVPRHNVIMLENKQDIANKNAEIIEKQFTVSYEIFNNDLFENEVK